MDLRSIMNTSEGAAAAAAAAALPGKPRQASQPPTTPGHAAPPPHPFRDYGQPPQASPSRSASFASPPPYPQPVGPYGGRPAPPPLQPLSSHDVRSPSASGPAPSPYRQTPTSSVSVMSAGYPFPPAQPPAPVSPVQRHQYPPASAYPRDSFSQPSAPVGMTGHPSYMHGQPIPQTPPVGTPGGAHPYIHQRSQSAHSTPTPTSAHSQGQQHYGAPYVQDSPVMAHHPPPQHSHEPVRHPSQPPTTPLGPPLSAGPRTAPGSFAQPPSPYQQRTSSSAASYAHPSQNSPPPPPPSAIPRLNTNQTLYDQQVAEFHRRSQSRSERGRSVSVSPKTRISSLPSAVGQPLKSIPDSDPRQNRAMGMSSMEPDRERAVTPAKRKLDERDLRPDEIDQQEARPPPFERVNGSHSAQFPPRASRTSTSPIFQRKMRPRYTEPPPWARVYEGQPLNKMNFVVRKGAHAQVNGRPEATTNADESRHTSPEAARSVTGQPVPSARDMRLALLGSWEESIIGERPYEELSKHVADFLFLCVVRSPDIGEVQSRGIQFEIEAKLGTLISKDTNDRISIPVSTECVLRQTGRVAFRSSMPEHYHKAFNELLNAYVLETDARHPNNAGRQKPRVPIKYLHRREIDKFYELPAQLQSRLPACIRSRLSSSKHSVKVRVTYDQKTGEVLGKIVKTRVEDLDIHFPDCPLDCRISVNLEMPWDGDVEEIQELAATTNREQPHDRNKDRLSYTHSHYSIDLTQVTQMVQGPSNTQRQEKEHELEIELNPGLVMEQGSRAGNGQAHAYQELVDGLVDNVRILARKARNFKN